MTRKTILAYRNHISDDHMPLIDSASAGISHSPLSNFYFCKQIYLSCVKVMNINVGLGSDIPAGHSPSIFEACLHAITASKALP